MKILKMKKLIILFLIALLWGWVDGYYRSDGTYVNGHYRDTSNDGESWNNVNQ